jgi:hypothetical protein
MTNPLISAICMISFHLLIVISPTLLIDDGVFGTLIEQGFPNAKIR